MTLAALALGSLMAGCQARDTSDVGTGYLQPVPAWVLEAKDGGCLPASEIETAQASHALKTFELFDRNSWMSIGATRYFARRRFRGIGQEVCPPSDLYPGLLKLLLLKGYFSGSYIFDTEVELARVLGPSDPRVVDAVGRTAFNSFAIPEEQIEILRRDIRPLARTVLAEFGMTASAYGPQASNEISVSSPLGTGAAQIAIATGQPGALSRVEKLMAETLSRYRDPIPREIRDRLFELAYAITFAGPNARDHLAPIYSLLDRKVESWAPPFGMIDLQPTTMCLVLRRVGGADAEKRLARPPCNSTKLVFPE